MRKKIGVIFISLFCFVAVVAWLLTTNETLASDAKEVSCVVGDANYNETFDVGDLVRLKRHLKTTELECSMDADLDVSGNLGSNDVVRCREMLVGDNSLQVTVTEEDWYKQLKDSNGYYAYYKLNKSLKEGWTLTFKVDFKENINCSVYGYYPGCDEWIYMGEQSDGVFRLVAEEDIAYLNIRVANTDNLTTVSDFRVYDIQVYKSAQGGELNDLVITYNQSTDMPVVYGINDTLDLTKFGVQTSEKNLSYKWTLKETNVAGTTTNIDMTDTAYQFSKKGNYTLAATVNTKGYSGSVSTRIMVVEPKIYIGFDGGTMENIGSAENTVDTYAMDATSNATQFVEYDGTVSYGSGVNGDANGAIVTNHYKGPYTVVKDYAFGTGKFTVSAWIKIPEGATLSEGKTSFLFGTMNPDGIDGFAITVQEKDAVGKLRVKVLDNAVDTLAISYERDSWYNVTVKRDGTSFKVYFDGEMVKEYTIDSNDTFGTKDLAFGAYTGLNDTYKDHKMCYDDIQVYNSALEDATIAKLASTDSVGPEVAIDFNNGKIENTGMNQKITVDKFYALKSDGKSFGDYSGTATYTTDVHGESNGAIVTNHRKGPHTVVEDYKLGTNNFTISAWFKVPDKSKLGNNSQAYLFGTDFPNTDSGIAANIKLNQVYQIRLQFAGKTEFPEIKNFEENTWYHLAVCRDGSELRWYLNGEWIHTFTNVTKDFGMVDISFGAAKNWATSNYGKDDTHTTYFDDVRIYSSAVDTKYFKEAYDSANEPQVHIDYTNSTVVNTGANTNITVGTYKMNAISGATMFETEPAVPYTRGAAYDKGGAISTNHKQGTYTVVRDYVFGANDFTVSTWFKIPQGVTVANNAGTMLVGIDHPNTTTGFAIGLRPTALRIQVAGKNQRDVTISYNKDTWYNLTVTREGAVFKVYFNGKQVGEEYNIGEDCDYGTRDLVFGAYHGVTWAYENTNTHFDEIKVYDGALTANEIAAVAKTDLGSEEWLINGEHIINESTTITNSNLFYVNDRKKTDDKETSGADPGCIYVTEGEYAGWYFAYIGHNNSTQVKCYKSKDLVSWKTADSSTNRCFDPLSDSSTWLEKDYANVGTDIWAPEVYYEDGTYYLFYSATSASDGFKCLGLATSDSPIGPFKDIGYPLFDGTTLANENSLYRKAGFIDAHPFRDPKTGEKYLYMARNRDNHETNIISVVKMKDWMTPDYSTYKELTTVDKTTYMGDSATERPETGATGGGINEAPQMTYHNGTYYLTLSVSGTTDKDYTVIQALGDNPMGPFTKVQQSKGGVILGVDLEDDYAWDHITCSGSHSFINAGDEWFILYHTHTTPGSIGAETGYIRSLALERMAWTTNEDGQTIMKSVGPTESVQPKPAAYSGYINIAPKATVTATNTASGSSASYLNDGLVRTLSSDCIKQFEGSGDVTITMKFDEFVKAKSLLIYNSWKYADAFERVSSVTFKYGEVVDGVRHIGTKTVKDVNFNMTVYSYTNSNDRKVMKPGSPMVLSLEDELEIIEVSIEIPCPSGKSSVAISDIALLGKALDEEADVHVSYNNGTMGYTSSDDAVTVGAYKLSAHKDKDSKFEDYTGVFSYETGVAGDANGALVTNHHDGPYTVIYNYAFGKDDFTISTWFKVPEGESMSKSGTYIFGTSNPDATSGFSVCIKNDGGYQLRLRYNGNTESYPLSDFNFTFGKWYHVTLCRDGSDLKLYLDGKLLDTNKTTTDYGTTALAVGAYIGWEQNAYIDANMCFDELKIYGSALSQEKIAALTTEYKN